MSNLSSSTQQANKWNQNTAFVPPACTINVATSNKKSTSRYRSQSKQHSNSSIRSLVRGSSPVGFGAAEEIEAFLRENETRSDVSKRKNTRKRSGAGTSKSSTNGRKPDCYVMSNPEVNMHRGF